MFWWTLRSLKGCNGSQYTKLDSIWVHLAFSLPTNHLKGSQDYLCHNVGSPGQVEVPETTSSFSQVDEALVKP